MINTGTGVALLAVALMGVVIGTVIVANTIYTSTTEHLKEFGTLKAIGASNWDLYAIIIEQALINSVIGFAVGMAVSYFVIQAMKKGHLAILLPAAGAGGNLHSHGDDVPVVVRAVDFQGDANRSGDGV